MDLLYEKVLRPAFFSLGPERAHELAMQAMTVLGHLPPVCRVMEHFNQLPASSTRPVEVFGLVAVDVRHRLKREAVVSMGSLSGSVVHPREVFAEAIACRAAGVILFHNHPSGDPEPSEEDLALTRRLVAGGALLGIEVLDHLILGAGRFVSLKTRGLV